MRSSLNATLHWSPSPRLPRYGLIVAAALGLLAVGWLAVFATDGPSGAANVREMRANDSESLDSYGGDWIPILSAGRDWRLHQAEPLDTSGRFAVLVSRERKWAVNVIDLESGITVVELETGYLPAAQLIDANTKLVVIDNLQGSDFPEGYTRTASGLVPRLMVFDLAGGMAEQVLEAPLPGYSTSMYGSTFAVASGLRSAYFLVRTYRTELRECQGGGLAEVCDRYELRAFDLDTWATRSVVSDLGQGCGLPLLSALGSNVAVTCSASGAAWVAQSGGTWRQSAIARSDDQPSKPQQGFSLAQAGFSVDGTHVALFANGTAEYTPAQGASRRVQAVPGGKRVFPGAKAVLMDGGRRIVVPFATEPTAEEAEGLAVFDVASGRVERVLDIADAYALHAVDSRNLLVIGEAGVVLNVDIESGAAAEVGSRKFPFSTFTE